MAIYTCFHNDGRSFDNLFVSAMQALQNAGIMSLRLNAETLKIKIEVEDELTLFSMVALWYGKYYCFNFHPGRKDVALTHTLDKCDMDKQLDESLASLRRLYESKT